MYNGFIQFVSKARFYTEYIVIFLLVKTVKKISYGQLPPTYNCERDMIQWLYSTGGYYDKSISGNYFNFDSDACLASANYNRYMATLLEIIKDTHLVLNFHDLHPAYLPYKHEFEDYLQTITKSYRTYNIGINLFLMNLLFSKIAGKRVLIINPSSSLMKQQYDNANVSKIYDNFPVLADIQIFENLYTFFNNGPDNSFFETADNICKEIHSKDFDICVISAGDYSSIVGNYIWRVMKKDVIVLGGNLLSIFGIKTGRNKDRTFNEFWISVPEHLKPNDYMKIENGCYW